MLGLPETAAKDEILKALQKQKVSAAGMDEPLTDEEIKSLLEEFDQKHE